MSPDLICIVESWLCQDILDQELNIPSYRLTRLDRDRHRGGIVFYIRNSLSFSVIKLIPELELGVINVHCVTGDVCVVLAYKPPSTPAIQYFDSLDDVLFDINCSNFSNTIFLDDLNVDVSSPNFSSTALSNTIEHFGLHLHPTGPTWVCESSATTIDIIASSVTGSSDYCKVVPSLSTSDHFGLLASLSCKYEAPSTTKGRRKVWIYKNADFDLANDRLLSLNVADIIISNDISASWGKFIRMLILT